MQKPNHIIDHSGILRKTIYPDGRTISYIYDEPGNLSKIIDSSIGSIAFQYDLLDRLTKVIFPDGRILSYGYDPAGNRIKTTYPNGEVIYYRYNKNNLLTEIITGSWKTRFGYDKAGRLIKKILPNGITVAYTYNSAGGLISLIITNSNNSTLLSFSYKLDAVGNYLEINKKSETSNQKINFTYDPLYRLIKVKYPDGGKVKYKYDALGNRLSVKGHSTNNNKGLLPKYIANTLFFGWKKTDYTYDSMNILIKSSDAEFKYNSNGSLAEKKVGNKTTRYRYDCENRLVKIEYPDGTYSQYTYDALGRRISKRYPDGTTIYYIYDGNNLIQEINDKGQVVASYVYGLRIDQPISMTQNGKTYYYLYDHLGSVIALTDETGKVVVEYEYDTWGNITKDDGDIPNHFRFTGREWDEESGFYYYRARYYDPAIGRFISRDPVNSDLTNPQTQNRYVYVNNNPQRYIDPFGLMPIEDSFGFISDILTGILEHGKDIAPKLFTQSGTNIGGILGNVGYALQPLELLPHFFNPNNLQAVTSSLQTATSIFGGWYGGSVGLALGAGAGLSSALITGGTGVVTGLTTGALAAGLSIGAPAVILGAVGAVVGSWAFKHVGRFITHTIETGGKNIFNAVQNTFNAIQSNVGGVLFDKSAEVLTDLEEITGAYWDDKLGQLVLVGKKNGKTEEEYLPSMDKDHLAVAIRAVFSGDNIGVSIDRPPSYLENGKSPPDGTMMPVRYLGNTKDTLFGAIMFEADRLLKNLSMGIDNETKERVTSNVPKYHNELDLSLLRRNKWKCPNCKYIYRDFNVSEPPDKCPKCLTLIKEKPWTKKPWTRMWFVIEDMRLEMVVKETADRKALCFGKATLKVKAEYISKEKNPGVDPIAEDFARHFTLHFDDFAKEFPVLERLRELAKISAIVKWLRNSDKPVDLSFLNDYEFIKVPTPEETPGITASKSKSYHRGNNIHTQTYSLYGGVDFDFKYQPIRDDGEALDLKKDAQRSKPCETTLAWDFKSKGKPQKALAFSLAKTNGNYIDIHIDFSLPESSNIKLELARHYDSFNSKSSIFGYGWKLNIPYEIFVINKQKVNSPILLINRLTGKSYKYIFIEDKQSYFLVLKEKEIVYQEGEKNKGSSFTYSYEYDSQKSIRRKVNGSFIYKSEDGITYNFDSQGRLTFIVDQDNRKLVYTYEGNKIVKISDSLGKSISLIYDNNRRIKQAICPGQRVVDYKYDQSGNLIRVSDNQGYIRNYIYDAYHRLIKVTGVRGRVILRNSYDPLGRVIKKKQDTIVDMGGNIIKRTYDSNYRLVKEEDKAGNTTTYKYDSNNNLFKAVLSDKQKRPIVFEYDRNERIKRIVNPLNHSIEFNYDSSSNIISIIDPNKNIISFEYDKNGIPVVIKDAMGNRWKQEFDHLSRLTGVVDPLGNKIEFTYVDNDNRLGTVTTPEGSIKYQYDKKGKLIKVIDPNSNSTEFIYDFKGNMIGIKDALGEITRY